MRIISEASQLLLTQSLPPLFRHPFNLCTVRETLPFNRSFRTIFIDYKRTLSIRSFETRIRASAITKCNNTTKRISRARLTAPLCGISIHEKTLGTSLECMVTSTVENTGCHSLVGDIVN